MSSGAQEPTGDTPEPAEVPWRQATAAIDEMFEGDLDAAEGHLLEALGQVRKVRHQRRTQGYDD